MDEEVEATTFLNTTVQYGFDFPPFSRLRAISFYRLEMEFIKFLATSERGRGSLSAQEVIAEKSVKRYR